MARTLEKTVRFISQFQALEANFQRLELALELNKELLCSRPESFGTVIGTDDWRYFQLHAFPGIPPVTIVFRFDDEKVYLLRAELIGGTDEAGEAGQ